MDRLLRPLHKWVWSDHDRRVRKLLIFAWNNGKDGKLKDVPMAERNRWVEDEIARIQKEQAARQQP